MRSRASFPHGTNGGPSLFSGGGGGAGPHRPRLVPCVCGGGASYSRSYWEAFGDVSICSGAGAKERYAAEVDGMVAALCLAKPLRGGGGGSGGGGSGAGSAGDRS
jgi:hypothetical protein